MDICSKKWLWFSFSSSRNRWLHIQHLQSCLWTSPLFLHLLFLLWSKLLPVAPVDAEQVVYSMFLEVFHWKQLSAAAKQRYECNKTSEPKHGTHRRKGSLVVTLHGFDDMNDCIFMWILLNSPCMDSKRWWLVTGIYKAKVKTYFLKNVVDTCSYFSDL